MKRVALLFAVVAGLATVGVFFGQWAEPDNVRALPPGGIDAFAATGQVTALSRLGQETVQVQGSVTIQRQDPHMDAGVEVADAEIIGLSFTGESVTGPITITESPALASNGEIRSMQAGQQFPAWSFFDTYIDVEIPASGTRTPGRLSLHNVSPLRLTAAGAINEWPPTGVKYASAPLQGVDNDGDTLIDEDTADDDLDGAYDEDPPGNFNEDTDDEIDEDGPVGVDNDGDTQVDEDPTCLPLFPTLPAGVCIVSVSVILGEVTTPAPTDTPCPPEICSPPPTRTVTATRTQAPTRAPTATPESTCEPARVSGSVYSDVLRAPLFIPDDDEEGVSDCFAVSASRVITDLNVTLEISHTWVGDLNVIVTHEQSGTSVVLIDRPVHQETPPAATASISTRPWTTKRQPPRRMRAIAEPRRSGEGSGRTSRCRRSTGRTSQVTGRSTSRIYKPTTKARWTAGPLPSTRCPPRRTLATRTAAEASTASMPRSSFSASRAWWTPSLVRRTPTRMRTVTSTASTARSSSSSPPASWTRCPLAALAFRGQAFPARLQSASWTPIILVGPL